MSSAAAVPLSLSPDTDAASEVPVTSLDKELPQNVEKHGSSFDDLHGLLTELADSLARASAADRRAALPRIQATFNGLMPPAKSPEGGTLVDFGLMVAGVSLWATFFGLGFWNSAHAILAAIPNADKSLVRELQIVAGSMIAVCISTVTNTGFLACISASLGCGYRRMSSLADEVGSSQNDYGRSILAGFFVYLVVLSGLLLLTTKALTNADQEQYVQLAGLLSVVAFVVGYHPQVTGVLFQKVESMVQPTRSSIVVEHRESESVQVENARVLPQKG